MSAGTETLPVFTETSAYSLAFVAVVGVAAYVSSQRYLSKNASWQDKFTWIWLVSFSRKLRRRGLW